MKELNAKPDGDKYIPKLHDVFIHKETENGRGKYTGKLTVFVVMEYFETDLKEFIQKKLKDLDEKKVL